MQTIDPTYPYACLKSGGAVAPKEGEGEKKKKKGKGFRKWSQLLN